MASVGSSLLPESALYSTPTITNVSLPLADTEYQVDIPLTVKKFSMRFRTAAVMKVATSAGDIASNLYFTLYPGEPYNVESAAGTSIITLYLQSSKPGQVLEIWSWV